MEEIGVAVCIVIYNRQCLFNENDKIDLLFWEGTPVDLGEFGYKEVK